jgi:hypothetical protein
MILVVVVVVMATGCSGSSSGPSAGATTPATEDPSFAASQRRNALMNEVSKKCGSQSEVAQQAERQNLDLSDPTLTVDAVCALLFPSGRPTTTQSASQQASQQRTACENAVKSKYPTNRNLTVAEISQKTSDLMACAVEDIYGSRLGKSACDKFWADLAAKPDGYVNTFTEGAGYLSDGTNCNPYKPK